MNSSRRFPLLATFVSVISWLGKVALFLGALLMLVGFVSKSSVPTFGPASRPNWIWVGVGFSLLNWGIILLVASECCKVILAIEDNTFLAAMAMEEFRSSGISGSKEASHSTSKPKTHLGRQSVPVEEKKKLSPLEESKHCVDCRRVLPEGMHMCAHCGTWNQ